MELTDNVIINDNNDEDDILNYVKKYINYESTPIRSGCCCYIFVCIERQTYTFKSEKTKY